MTRNVMLCFLQNLTTSKKQQSNQLQASGNSSKKISDSTLFGVSKSKSATKAKLKCEIDKIDSTLAKSSIVNGKPKKKTSSKSKFFLRKSRSTNSVSLSLRSSSPATEAKHHLFPKQQNPVSGSQPSSFTVASDEATCANNKSVDNKPTKRKSLGDVAIIPTNLTHFSIKHDLSRKNQLDCSSIKPVVSNTNVMPNMTSSTNGVSDTIATASSSAASSTSMSAAAATTTQDHLQPPTHVNLSSNSSINSSSVKSIASKSNDGTSTEKKRKSLSSSRQKKFHRRFKQVSMDEEVINYFSCAFVSDILLQGFLYITKNHIAFYSNVFGYVTKLLIPVTSVARISKEKIVKIFPNAIAVATIDERHVFASFLSREVAFQLMISVWKEALPMCQIDVTNTSAQLRICTAESQSANSSDAISDSKMTNGLPRKTAASPTSTLQVVQQLRRPSNSGISEIDDESSSAISGSEGLTQKHILCGEPSFNNASTSSCNSNSNSNPSTFDLLATNEESNFEMDASKCLTESKVLSSTPKTNEFDAKCTSNHSSTISFFQLQIPRTIHIAYFGLSLVIILTLLAIFLYYRISEMRDARISKTFSMDELNSETPNVHLYAEVLKWQKDMQAQKVHLTKNVLANNLEQISQISDSLQTLSSLIHSNQESNQGNEKISTIMDACSSLEECVMEQDSQQP